MYTMCHFFKFLILKLCINIMFMNYTHNINTHKNLDVLKNEIITLIDKSKSEKTTFRFNSFKLLMRMKCNQYKYMYPKYSNYLEDFMTVLKIENNDIFIQEFITKVNICDDLFVLYLLFIIWE